MKKAENKADVAAKYFHSSRRAFIILKDSGILFAEENGQLSHLEILIKAGFTEKKAEKVLQVSPRGYYKDNNLVFYQGDFLPLTDESVKLVRKYKDDFVRMFGINPDTKIFRGVKQNAVGTIWTPIHSMKL